MLIQLNLLSNPIKRFLLCCILYLLLSALGIAADQNFKTTPQTNHGKKWRIAYLEGGPYHENVYTFKALVNALVETGWLEPVDFPGKDYTDDCRFVWDYLVKHARSRFLEFVPDGFWNANYSDKIRKELRRRIIKRLNTKNDIDLIIAMGTLAGQDLANTLHNTPTIVIASNDPITSGIVKSAQYSGLPHIHAQVEPNRYRRQIELFHSIFQFKKLGIAHGKGVTGGSYAAVDHIKELANKKGFEVITCISKDDILDLQEAYKSVVTCYTKLAETVDAIYITQQRGITLENLPEILAPVLAKKIPMFSQTNVGEVKNGVLMSVAQASLNNVAKFHASNIAKTLNGAKPGELNQIFNDPIKVAINFKTLEKIARMDLFDKIYKILPYTEEYYY